VGVLEASCADSHFRMLSECGLALKQIASNPLGVQPLEDAGALLPLLNAARLLENSRSHKENEAHGLLVGALSNLAAASPSVCLRLARCKDGELHVVTNALQNGRTANTRQEAAALLANLAELPEGRDALLKESCILGELVKVVDFGEDLVVQEAVRAIANLGARLRDEPTSLQKNHVVASVTQLLQDSQASLDTRTHCVTAIASLALSRQGAQQVVQAGAIVPLAKLVMDEELDEGVFLDRLLLALSSLMEHSEEACEEVAQAGTTEVLTEMVRTGTKWQERPWMLDIVGAVGPPCHKMCVYMS